jgi:hypothetical protein
MRSGDWLPTSFVIAALVALLVFVASIANRQADAIADRDRQLDRIGAHLNTTQLVVTHLQSRLVEVQSRPLPQCPPPPPPRYVKEDVGHDTPIFSKQW